MGAGSELVVVSEDGGVFAVVQLLLAAQRVRDGDTLNCPVSEVNLFAGKWCGRFVVSGLLMERN